MNLSDYAKIQGVTYRTGWNCWKRGLLKGHQLPIGTIIVDVEAPFSKPESTTHY